MSWCLFWKTWDYLCTSASSASYFLGIKTQFSWPLRGNSGNANGDLELSAKAATGTEESIGNKQLSMYTSITILTQYLEGTGDLQTGKRNKCLFVGFNISVSHRPDLWGSGFNSIQVHFPTAPGNLETRCKGNSKGDRAPHPCTNPPNPRSANPDLTSCSYALFGTDKILAKAKSCRITAQ